MQNLACIQSIPTAGTGHQPQGRREGRSPDDDTLNWESPASAAHADGVNDPSLKAQCKKFERAEVGVSELEIFCILDVDMGGERGFADMQDVLRLADLIDRPARQGSEKGDER